MASIDADDKTAANQSLLQKTGKTQAAFVPKLYIMVKNMKQPTPEDPHPEQPLICWSKAGDVFCVYDPMEFSRVILPLHFKHNNWQSFVRQLNMYGFHKVNDLLSSSHCQPDTVQAWEFRHGKRSFHDLPAPVNSLLFSPLHNPSSLQKGPPRSTALIKRKSTKHHGSSKAGSTALAIVQPTSQVGETHFQRQMPASNGSPGAPARTFQSYMPRNQTSPVPLSAHRPLHGKPPPPSLHIGKADTSSNIPLRPPVLYPILTHQFQYTHSTHSQLKSSSPLLKHSSTKGSPSTRATPQPNCLIPCSPRSVRLPTSLNRPITSQSQQFRRCDLQEEEVTESSFAWSSVQEAACTDNSSLSKVEDELRRLNHTLTHRDPNGNHVFSVLGLIVELVTLLVDKQEFKVVPAQKGKLSRYGKRGFLQDSNICPPLSHLLPPRQYKPLKKRWGNWKWRILIITTQFRRCSGVPSTDSLSPISADPLEISTLHSADRCRSSVDSNHMKTTDGSSSTSWSSRPRWSIRMNSSQSLPPLNTMMAPRAPPGYNRTYSSSTLPASINRLMNADTDEYPNMALDSEEYPQQQEDRQGEGEYENGARR
ncbi:hypothetical protein PSHT_07569 [Puccinia striiformis]|uniref:HSF-type DNA-binding domain-containing protein n=1 Tax=Puccinia striiformis TaxID=27350 RepID=A0A2S4VWL6_9BASI|nr:hypothetical protein PSHT_07569 [Puccinia striiformis]